MSAASHDGAPAMSQAPTIADEARSLEEEFALFDDWRDKVEYIIDLGKNLPALPEPLKTETNKVRGCQSQVWMVAEPEPGGRVHWRADSDAVLVKGLISLLLRLYDRRTPREVLDNPPDVLERVGLSKFLTPGRANGLYAMVGRMRSLAEALAAARSA
jgi:cysteine desulfuration protein SufE